MTVSYNTTSEPIAVYQPIYCLKTGNISGFEALARQHTDNGNPTDTAQNLDFPNLASTMLKQSLAALKELHGQRTELFMQVNLSAADLACTKLTRNMPAMVQTLPRNSMRIELTEHDAMDNLQHAHKILSELRAAGFGLMLDDFSAGHSSLAWLADLPASGIKIDPKLVRKAGKTRANLILCALIDLAHQLDLSVTAEGIEDTISTKFFAKIGCDYGQGYALGRPVSRDSLPRLLNAGTVPALDD